MSDAAPLLAAIAANPDDDLPRLVYADWLDETGDPDRAEFIRLQCHSARVGPLDPSWAPCKLREHDLFTANSAKWRPAGLSAQSRMLMAHWRRGFPALIDLTSVANGRLTGGEWCNGAFDLPASPDEEEFDALRDTWPPIGSVREVSFSGWGTASGEVLRCEQLRVARVMELSEWESGLRNETLEQFLVDFSRLPSGWFPELAELKLSDGELSSDGLEALTNAPALQTVKRLHLQFPMAISGIPSSVEWWRHHTRGLFAAIAPRLERLELYHLPPFLVEEFSAVAWPRLRSLSINHLHEEGLAAYDFSNTPNLTTLSISHDSGRRRFDPNPLEAFDDGWPEDSLKVLCLGPVPVESLRPWLAYPERFSLDFLSAEVQGRNRLTMSELASYPLTRGLKGLAGLFTNADLAPLVDPAILPELHTVWSGDRKLPPPLHWRGGPRTVIPRDDPKQARERPTRNEWCRWHDDLLMG